MSALGYSENEEKADCFRLTGSAINLVRCGSHQNCYFAHIVQNLQILGCWRESRKDIY